MRTVHEGVSPTLLFALFFIILGGLDILEITSTVNVFCDVTLVCEDGHIITYKFIISSCSPLLENVLNVLR